MQVSSEGDAARSVGRLDGLIADAELLDVTTLVVDTTAVVSPLGEVDLSTAPDLAAAMAGALVPGVTRLEIDCAGVTFLDSSGIRVLVEAWQSVHNHSEVEVVVVNADGGVAQALRATGVWDLLHGG